MPGPKTRKPFGATSGEHLDIVNFLHSSFTSSSTSCEQILYKVEIWALTWPLQNVYLSVQFFSCFMSCRKINLPPRCNFLAGWVRLSLRIGTSILSAVVFSLLSFYTVSTGEEPGPQVVFVQSLPSEPLKLLAPDLSWESWWSPSLSLWVRPALSRFSQVPSSFHLLMMDLTELPEKLSELEVFSRHRMTFYDLFSEFLKVFLFFFLMLQFYTRINSTHKMAKGLSLYIAFPVVLTNQSAVHHSRIHPFALTNVHTFIHWHTRG